MLNGSDNNIFRRLARRLALALAVLFALAGAMLTIGTYGVGVTVIVLFIVAVFANRGAVDETLDQGLNEWGVHDPDPNASSATKRRRWQPTDDDPFAEGGPLHYESSTHYGYEDRDHFDFGLYDGIEGYGTKTSFDSDY
jgi:hypothetical protein